MSEALKEIREDYRYYTSEASKINRSLGLAGIAIIWIFKGEPPDPLIPTALILPLFFLVLALLLDISQYVIGGLIWWLFLRVSEIRFDKGERSEEELTQRPKWLALIIHCLYFGKLITMAISYVYLIKFFIPLIKALNQNSLVFN